MATRSWIGALACAVLVSGVALFAPASAEAQTCGAIQQDAFDLTIDDVGIDADDFGIMVNAAPTTTHCAKICVRASKGCRKSLRTDLRADLIETATLLRVETVLCRTADDVAACKILVKAARFTAKALFKLDKASIGAACTDVNLVTSCNVFCNTGVAPADCEGAFDLP